MSLDERSGSVPGILSEEAVRSRPAFLVLGGLLLAWELWVRLTDTAAVILPGPVAIGEALVANWPSLLEGSLVTAGTAFGGLAGGIVVGAPIAYLVARSDGFAALFLPYVLAMRVAPVVAIAPLLVLWLGDGIPARILLVTTMTIFPVVIATSDGLRAVPAPYLDLARSVDASGPSTFLRVEVPAAAPSIFAGAKLAAALSVVGAVVAEFVTLESGLGFQIFEAATALEIPAMFAALGVLALLGTAFYGVPALLERRSHVT